MPTGGVPLVSTAAPPESAAPRAKGGGPWAPKTLDDIAAFLDAHKAAAVASLVVTTERPSSSSPPPGLSVVAGVEASASLLESVAAVESSKDISDFLGAHTRRSQATVAAAADDEAAAAAAAAEGAPGDATLAPAMAEGLPGSGARPRAQSTQEEFEAVEVAAPPPRNAHVVPSEPVQAATAASKSMAAMTPASKRASSTLASTGVVSSPYSKLPMAELKVTTRFVSTHPLFQ